MTEKSLDVHRERIPANLAAQRSRLVPLLIVVGAFVLSRLLFFHAGVRFDAGLLSHSLQVLDPELLKTRILESLYHLHMQPPMYNLLLGTALKCFPGSEALAFACAHLLLGLVLHVSIFLVMTRLGVSARLAVLLTVLFMVSPACILYESWLFYTYPVAALLIASALFLHAFLSGRRLWSGVVFFSLIAVIALTRSLFHLVYVVLLIGALVLCNRRDWRRIVYASAIPLTLVLLVYAKNLCVFGMVTTSSWGGMNFSKITTFSLTNDERIRLVQEGKLSEWALKRPFARRGGHGPDFSKSPGTGIPVLDQEVKSTGGFNYNHIAYVDFSKHYMADALRVLALRPGTYLRGVVSAYRIYLQPASEYGLLHESRRRLRGYESMYNLIFYGERPGRGFQIARDVRAKSGPPVREAWLLLIGYPLLLLYGLVKTVRVVRRKPFDVPQAMTLLFLSVTALYVTLVSNAVELGENNRFRFMIDPLAVVLLGLLLYDMARMVPESLRPMGLLRNHLGLKRGLSKRSVGGTTDRLERPVGREHDSFNSPPVSWFSLGPGTRLGRWFCGRKLVS